MNNKGFTLIEMIIFIIIGAIFLPTSMIALNYVLSNYSRPDYTLKARFYAEKRMTEITAVPDYDSIVPGGSCPTVIEDQGTTKTDDDYTIQCYIKGVDSDLKNNTSENPKEPYKRVVVIVKHIGLLKDYDIQTVITRRAKKAL